MYNKESAIEFINKAIENAESLYADAELLEINDRLSRAFTLYQFSNEEIGKSMICMDYLLRNEFIPKNINKVITNHIKKSERSVGIEFLIASALAKQNKEIGLWYLLGRVQSENNKPKELNDLKNNSLYVGMKNRQIQTPPEIISNTIVQEAKLRVLLRMQSFKAIFNICCENIEELQLAYTVVLSQPVDISIYTNDFFDN